LRFACNHAANSLPALKFEHKLRSSHVRAQVTGSTVRFHDGRGWGHGVGMCQYGAQAMAKAGYDGKRIVQRYYPAARVQRLY